MKTIWRILGLVLATTLFGTSARGGEQFTFQTAHYMITTDVEKGLAKDIGKHMDAVYEEYASRMSGFRAKTSKMIMPLYVWNKYETYLEFLRGYGFNAANSGGVYFRSQKGDGLSTWVEGQSRLKMYYVLQHEGFHQFAAAKIHENLPPWVNEGLAEYFGDALLINGRLVVGKLDEERLKRMNRAIAAHTYLPFDQLMNMNNDQWVARVTGGDKASSLMYDMSWSVCYFLIHSDKKYRAALEQYLDIMNQGQTADVAFTKVFGKNIGAFEKSWSAALPKFEADPWFTSVRRVQFYAEILKALHKQKVKVTTFPRLRELVIKNSMAAKVKERDIVVRDEKDIQLANEAEELSFPKPAEVELVASEDPKLPDGMVIRGLKPTTIRLSWKLDADGVIVEDLNYEKEKTSASRPKPKPATAKPQKPMTKPTTKTTTQSADDDEVEPEPMDEEEEPATQPTTQKVDELVR